MQVQFYTYNQTRNQYYPSFNGSKTSQITTFSKAQIETMLESGFSISKICESLKITMSFYRQLVERLNIKTPNKKYIEHNSSIIES